MRFLRIGPVGAEIPHVRVNGSLYDIRPITSDIDGPFLTRLTDDVAGIQRRVEELIASGGVDEILEGSFDRIGASLPRPQALLCIGQNYEAHARETDDEPPEVPIVFLKHPNTIVGPYDPILRPPGAETLDWEVELSVVVGKQARYLPSLEAAADVIAGYTVCIDVSERTNQIAHSGGQWSKGKSAETFCPIGPEFVTADEVDPQDLRLWSRVNGAIRQDAHTSRMIFQVTELVRDLSQYMVLEPGDIINTGTPEGVAISGKFKYLSPGDTVEVGIDGLGLPQSHEVKQASA